MSEKRREEDNIKWLRKNYLILSMIFLLIGSLITTMNWVDAKDDKVKEYVDKQDQEIVKRMKENSDMIVDRIDRIEDKMDVQQKLLIDEIKRSR